MEIGVGASIGQLVVIGPGVRIEPHAKIAAHVTIGADCHIGERAILHSGVRIGARCRIGDDFIAQPNAIIGADGFSFEPPERGADRSQREIAEPIQVFIQEHIREVSHGKPGNGRR